MQPTPTCPRCAPTIRQVDFAPELVADGASHTPAPWSVWCYVEGFGEAPADEAQEASFGVAAGQGSIAQAWMGLVGDRVVSSYEALSNVQLMAAAPDLLAALKEIVDASDAYDETEIADLRCLAALDAARIVLAKAA